MHWAAKYIGLPYQSGGRGPEVFDCWGLFRWIYQQEFGIVLPEIPGISQETLLSLVHTLEDARLAEWSESRTPFDGCGVGMSQNKSLHHVGIFIKADGGKILHCQEGSSTVAEPIRHLKLKGFRTIQFFRHRLWQPSS